MSKYNCIVILGPTASGKTKLACNTSFVFNGEIISADSRQVYKGLDIGTGKDLEEYTVKGKHIPYHLINCIDPDHQFYLLQFTEGLQNAFHEIISKGKLPIICGGTGLYLDALKKDFSFTQIKEHPELRAELEYVSKEDLVERLKKYPPDFTGHVDLNSKKRIIRGIEIAEHFSHHGKDLKKIELPYKPFYIGINPEIEDRKQRISERLRKRLDQGLIEETKTLLEKGVTHERLEFFGLEYKYTSLFLKNEIDKEQLFTQLQTAIFQFAKRQMTWFRKMEKEGVNIHWIKNENELLELLSGEFKSI